VVKTGRIMFEMSGVGEAVAKDALRLAANKLPIETRFVVKESFASLSTEATK
jgi:large subunit ribosomal protein L16